MRDTKNGCIADYWMSDKKLIKVSSGALAVYSQAPLMRTLKGHRKKNVRVKGVFASLLVFFVRLPWSSEVLARNTIG